MPDLSSKTRRQNIDDLRTHMCIVIPSQTLRINAFSVCDDLDELLNNAKRTRKPL